MDLRGRGRTCWPKRRYCAFRSLRVEIARAVRRDRARSDLRAHRIFLVHLAAHGGSSEAGRVFVFDRTFVGKRASLPGRVVARLRRRYAGAREAWQARGARGEVTDRGGLERYRRRV